MNSIDDQLQQYGLKFDFSCSLQTHPEIDDCLLYQFEGCFSHEEFPGDVIRTKLTADIYTDRGTYDLYAIATTSMEKVRCHYETKGEIAGVGFDYSGDRSQQNCSVMWSLGKTELGDNFFKPQKSIEKSLAMSVRSRIMKLAEDFGVKHDPIEPEPVSKPATPLPTPEAVAPARQEMTPVQGVEENEPEEAETAKKWSPDYGAPKRTNSFFGT